MLVEPLFTWRWFSRLTGAVSLLTATASLPPTVRAQGPDPSLVGEWSGTALWPVNATHAVLLPTGNLLFWREKSPYLWDPATEDVTAAAAPGYDAFCSAHAFIGDGRLFVTGGALEDDEIAPEHGSGGKGLREASYYDPFSNAWTQLPPMNAGRWYPTNTSLPNGDVLVISGSTATGAFNGLPQVWQVASSTWRNLSGVARLTERIPLYPWMFVAPSGSVFMAGSDPLTRSLDTGGTGSWSIVGSSNFGRRRSGSSVMYDEGKVLIVGGTTTEQFSPTNTGEVIDLQGDSTWRYVAPMAEPRVQLNATLLPDGKVLVTGGHKGVGHNDPTQPVYLAEMWDPQTETWSNMASMAIFRGYHSTATLLPDGRVVSAGGDGADPSGNNREIYSPPYLFNGPRPTILSAPTAVGYGQTFFVETPDASSITNVNWLALGATTHALNMGQRINRLTFAQAQGGLDVTAPPGGTLCPPGYYMLFILTNDGVPSVARIVKIG